MSAFRVLEGGILSLIEDFGRFGLCDKGITNSGVMDEYAYIILNHLLQNPAGTNCIEITMGGLKLKAEGDSAICVTGGNISFSINSKKAELWKTHSVKKGDILEFGYVKSGLRVYFGVKGGFDIEKEFGSNSVTIKEGIGEKLKSGDMLRFSQTKSYDFNIKLKDEFIPLYPKELVARVVLGYQDNFFDKEEVEKFFSQNYKISAQNNRMGYRLEGESVKCNLNGIVSEGICFGAIQIPKDGQPIVLLKDRQTIGGYPKIGSVLPIDCFRLSQLKAGDKIRFEKIDISYAQEKMRLFSSLLTLQI